MQRWSSETWWWLGERVAGEGSPAHDIVVAGNEGPLTEVHWIGNNQNTQAQTIFTKSP